MFFLVSYPGTPNRSTIYQGIRDDLVHFWSFKGDCPPAFVLVHSLAVAKEAVHDYRVALRDGHPVRSRSLRELLWLDAQRSSSGRLVSSTRK